MTAIILDLSGYVLEKPRVADSNASSTAAPDAMTLAGFNPTMRSDYLVLAQQNALLKDARFAWVKNGVRKQFGFSDSDKRWVPLYGNPPESLGVISNTTRLKIVVSQTLTCPFRVYPTNPSTLAFTTYNFVTVFSMSLPAGTVEINTSSGELNFSATDLSTYSGETIYYQGQQFFPLDDSLKGAIGTISNVPVRLALNPIPISTQHPVIQIGHRMALNVVAVNDESGFGSPSAGMVEWSRNVGTLNFSSDDITSFSGETVYYLGVYDDYDASVPFSSINLGNLNGSTQLYPTHFSVPLVEGGDIIVYQTGPGGSIYQFPYTKFVDSFSTNPTFGTVEINRATGYVKCDSRTASIYAGWPGYAFICDYTLSGENIAVRFFRSPINIGDLNPNIYDVNAIVNVQDTTLVSKLPQSSMLMLPVLPIEYPVPSGLINPEFKIDLGYTQQILKDIKNDPSTGDGWVIDYGKKQLFFVSRTQFSFSLPSASQFYQFPQAPIYSLDALRNTTTSTDLKEGDDYLVDKNAGMAFFVDKTGRTLLEGTGSITGTHTFVDSDVDFTGMVGKYLTLLSGSNQGSYVISAITNPTTIQITTSIPFQVSPETGVEYEVWSEPEIIADRAWETVPIPETYFRLEKQYPLGIISNSPKLTVPVVDESSRLSFSVGPGILSHIQYVIDDSHFTSLAAGHVQISSDTGNLNFSTADLTTYAGQTVTQIIWLYPSDYTFNYQSGSIYLNTPMLIFEKLKTYYYMTDGGDLQQEFLPIRVLSEEVPLTSGSFSAHFNADGRELSSSQGTLIYRGRISDGAGRFYKLTSTQTSPAVSIDWTTSTLNFSTVLTSDDSVSLDYWAYNAFGGEKSFTLSQFPVYFPAYSFTSGDTSFLAYGDMTTTFDPHRLINIDNDIYEVLSSAFASGKTTVNLTYELKKTKTSSNFLISSQPIDSSYYQLITTRFEKTQKNSYTMTFKSSVPSIKIGTVLKIWSKQFLVLSSRLDDNGKMIVQVGVPFDSEYVYSAGQISQTIRPIYTAGSVKFYTENLVVKTQPILLRLRTSSQVTNLINGTDYRISEVGEIELTNSDYTFGPDMTLELNYTGRMSYPKNTHFLSKYVFYFSPDDKNQYLGLPLIARYSVYTPDSFYFRVEPVTSISTEVIKSLSEAASSQAASSGPPGPPPPPLDIDQKGNGSYFYNYSVLYDEDDLVACRYLKYYNSICNRIGDLLSYFDGRVIGDQNGKFLFDGNRNWPTPVEPNPSSLTNNIDQLIYTKPSFFGLPRPYSPMWVASKYSRLYPEYAGFWGKTSSDDSFETDILDLGHTNIASVRTIQDRLARSQLVQPVEIGSSDLYVENVSEDTILKNPAFVAGQKICVDNPSHTSSLLNATIVSVDTGLNILHVNTAASVRLEIGDTVYRDPTDSIHTYRVGYDVGVDAKDGTLVSIKDSSFSGQVTPPVDSYLNGFIKFGNPLTKPYRVPALDNNDQNDWGDYSLPLLSPSQGTSIPTLIANEVVAIGKIQDSTYGTTEGTRGSNGVIQSNYQQFDLGQAATGIQANDILQILIGANAGKYLVSGMSGNLVTVGPRLDVSIPNGYGFKHVQNGNVSYNTTGGRSGGTATISDFWTLYDSTANFLTVLNPVHVGDTLTINSINGSFNHGSYIVEQIPDGEHLKVRVFSSIETGLVYDVKKSAITRISGLGHWDDLSHYIGNPSADFSHVVRGDALIITNGRNIGTWTISSVDNVAKELTVLPGSTIRIDESNSCTTVYPHTINVGSALFDSSDIGRTIVISNTTDRNGPWVISGVTNSTSITVSASWTTLGSQPGNFILLSSYLIKAPRRESYYVTTHDASFWYDTLVKERDTIYNDLMPIIQDLFDTVFGGTPVLTGTDGSVNASAFDDPSADFQAANIAEGDVLQITNGASLGYYWVTGVNSAMELAIDATLGAESGLTYKVFKGNSTFSDDLRRVIMDAKGYIDQFYSDILDALLYTAVDSTPPINPDHGDPTGDGTNGYLVDRIANVEDFPAQTSDFISRLQDAATSVDKLYDVQYSWIDYRTNLEYGTLPKISTLNSQRAKKQIELIQKLLMSKL